MNRTKKSWFIVFGLASVLIGIGAATKIISDRNAKLGKQPDGGFVVSTGQRIQGGAISFVGRPIDLALHPSGEFFAVMCNKGTFLCTAKGVMDGTSVNLGASPAFRGLHWTPDGKTLIASTSKGHLKLASLAEGKLVLGAEISLAQPNNKANPEPGGFSISADGNKAYVACAGIDRVAVVNLDQKKVERHIEVGMIPFESGLSPDGSTLVVSNWGGRVPKDGDRKGKSASQEVVIDKRGVPSTGSISIIDLQSGTRTDVASGLHPSSVAFSGDRAYVTNAQSDTITELDWKAKKVVRTIRITFEKLRVIGSIPNALAVVGDKILVCNGGDNAICEIDRKSGKVQGFRPAGYFPAGIQVSADGKSAYVVNNKGYGSVANTLEGKNGNAHDFQGTISVIDLSKDLAHESKIVGANNHWGETIPKPKLKVYNGAIKHVLYIIKENRTYDEIFGDLPQGNGDPKLCSLGEKVMPNHRKIVQQFTLFDNGYVTGTNSAEGHNWATQGLANDYLERFYVGYSRSYPDEGDDSMALSSGGAIWDAALRKGRSVRVYGEFCDATLAEFKPQPKDWFEVWEDRQKGTKKFQFKSKCRIPSLQGRYNDKVMYWPLLQMDQIRADEFIREYTEFSKQDKVPNLMIMSLPCDHSEGVSAKYPTPRAMMADNDLALGRVIDAVSHSPQWKDTCIFVIEDDAQSGPDHVDGHRTSFMAISPYSARKTVDSTLYTNMHMLRSMEMMLGLDPMNRFDALAYPMEKCFSDTPDLTPYTHVQNNIPLDERNKPKEQMTRDELYWANKSAELNWSHLDSADPYWLNRIIWFSVKGSSVPFPARAGEEPGQFGEEEEEEEETDLD